MSFNLSWLAVVIILDGFVDYGLGIGGLGWIGKDGFIDGN